MPRPDTPLSDAILRTLQDQDLQAITDPNTMERLLQEHVGGSEEVKYAAVQRAMLLVSLLEERGFTFDPMSTRHLTATIIGGWLEGFLTGAMVASTEEMTP